MDTSQAIIVKKIKKGGHGHHGGAWKVAFADFVTAMMAFFLLMWLMGSTTPEEKAAISDFFQNPSAVQGPGGASTSMIKLGAIDDDVVLQKKEGETSSSKTEKSEGAGKALEITEIQKEVEKQIEVQKDAQRLDNLKSDLEKAIEASQAMKPFKDQLLLDITSEGLRIQIVDKKNRPMFDSGSAHMKGYAKTLLREMARLINKVPNKISLTGHTDATPYSSSGGYTNWELSSDRANASRRALVVGGLGENKIAKVVGLSSTVLFDDKNPRNPINRRISLIVMNKAAEEALFKDGQAEVSNAGEAANVLLMDTAKPATTQNSILSPVKPMLPTGAPQQSKQPVTLTPGQSTSTASGVPAPLSGRVPTTLGKQPKLFGKSKPTVLGRPASKVRQQKKVNQKQTGMAPGVPAEESPPATDKQKPTLNQRVIRPIKPIKPITPFQLP